MRYYYAEDGHLLERPRRLIFAFKPRFRGTGSRYMRCDQLASFVRRFFGDKYDVSVEVMSHPQKKPSRWAKFLRQSEGAAIILLKGSPDILSPEQLESLRAKATCVCIDHVDSFAGGKIFEMADLHIAASKASQNFMQEKRARISDRRGLKLPPIALVDHHADPRIKPTTEPEDRNLKIAYLGKLENTFIPSEITQHMLTLSADAQSDFEQALSEIGQAHLHYAVRNGTNRQPKPFTKGFTAALANRNVICTPDVDDAVRFLGDDYPFLARGSDKQSIIDIVEFARESKGSSVWKRGLRSIEEMRHEISPERVARQLVTAIDPFF